MQLINAAAVSIGSLLIVVAILLYEDDERRLQNRLEEWWVRIVDAERAANIRGGVFLRALSGWTGHLIDHLFGSKLLTRQAIGVSGCLSAASLVGLLAIIHQAYRPPRWDIDAYNRPSLAADVLYSIDAFYIASSNVGGVYAFVTAGLVFLLAALAPSLSPKLRSLPLATLGLAGISLIVVDVVRSDHWKPSDITLTAASGFYLGTALAAASDFLLLLAVRSLLRVLTKSEDVLAAAVLSMSIVAVTATLACAPVLTLAAFPDWRNTVMPILAFGDSGLEELLVTTDQDGVLTSGVPVADWSAAGVGAWLLSDFYDIMIGMFAPAVMLGLLFYRALWQLVQRPLYALQRFGVYRHRKAIATIGALLVVAALPQTRSFFATVIGWF